MGIFDNWFLRFLEDQLWFQSLLFGLVLKSTWNIFSPVSIKPEFSEKDILEICKKREKEKEQEEKYKKMFTH